MLLVQSNLQTFSEERDFLIVLDFNCGFWVAELLDNLRPVSPKPGHLERVKTPQGNCNTGADELQTYRERFLKINVRHITDGQVSSI